MELCAAIDFSGNNIHFALGSLPGKNLILSAQKLLRGREASGILSWLEENLKFANFAVSDVLRWTVGTGPGSFTGMRIVSALISGLSFQNEKLFCRGISSAAAIAAATNPSARSKTAVLYDARNHELLLCGIEKSGDLFSPSLKEKNCKIIRSADKFFEAVCHFDKIAALEKDRPAISSVLSEELMGKITFLKDFPVHRLLFMESGNWLRKSLLELHYIRPAVYVSPLEIRINTQ